MLRNLIVLPDGTEIFSGGRGTAVMACTVTRSVGAGESLAPGAVCAAMVELTLWEETPLALRAGDSFTLYTVDEADTRTQRGVFIAQKPVRTGNILQLTAYDRLRLLDKDLTAFLAAQEGWPYSLLQLADMVCGACGLSLQNEEIPNGSFPVERFSGEGITGRMVMEWVAQAAGCFCRADENGQPELAWFTPAALSVGPEEIHKVTLVLGDGLASVTAADGAVLVTDGTVTFQSAHVTAAGEGVVTLTADESILQQYAREGGIALEEFTTPPIEKVVLRQTETDVGTAWPENTEGTALCITGNPLLAAKNAQTLLPVAQTLYDRFHGIRYTPGKLQMPHGPWDAGQVLTVTDKAGGSYAFYIMDMERTAAGDTLTCTGSAQRESVEAVQNRSAQSLAGRVLNLRADVEGILAENAAAAGAFAKLKLDVSGIQGQVSSQSGQLQSAVSRLSTLEQTANGLQLTVEAVRTDGVSKLKTAMGYTFDDSGLRIDREGQQMKNRLDNTGMYIQRGDEPMLQANDKGVVATDVTVRNYLIVGNHARLEDYTAGRTACFYLEGMRNGT